MVGAMLVGSERAAHIPSSFSCACGPAAFTLATSGLIISHCLVVRISISTYSLLPFCLDPEGPRRWRARGTVWCYLFSVHSRCCQRGCWRLLTQSVSPLWSHNCLLIRAECSVSLFQSVLCCQPSFRRDCGCSIVGLPGNTTICTLEQLLNLGQLLVGVLQSEDFARLWLNFEMTASRSVKEPLLHAHKTDLSLLSLEEGGDPFLPQHAEFVWPHTLQAVTAFCECFWYGAKSKIWFR